MTKSIQDISQDLAKIVAGAASGVVSISSGTSRSSGFVWRPGLIVTADEALGEEGPFEVTFKGGEKLPAKLVGRDPSTDVALLKVEDSSHTPAKFSASDVAAGQFAIAVGSDEGEAVAAFGIISRVLGPWQSMRGGDIDQRIDLSLNLRRSAEGSLVFDAGGNAIGMAVFGPRRRVLIIPASTIERVASHLEAHGRVARGYLGLGLQPVQVDGGGAGAMVMSVDAQGPAKAAGVQQGDVIVSWNGKPIEHLKTLLRSLGPKSIGEKVAIGLRRAGAVTEISFRIAERPAA